MKEAFPIIVEILLCHVIYVSITALTRGLVKGTNLPYTVIMFILGCALGVLSVLVEEVSKYTLLAGIDPHLILHIFLPVLVFDSAYALEPHTLIKSFSQVVLLSIPGFSESKNIII